MKKETDTLEEVHFLGCGAILRLNRDRKKLSLEVVAERIGVNKSTLQRYETNETPVSDGTIKLIAKALRVKATTLMRECLFHLRPKLRGSPFGDMIASMDDWIEPDSETDESTVS